MASVKEIDALLPQTQCGECSYSGCLPYAEALAQGSVSINKCPPGGVATVKSLGALLGIDPAPYLHEAQEPTRAPSVAMIREVECIGCTKCIKACPVDAIIGSGKLMHAVIAHECTGCGLCVAPCPVDCIEMVTVSEPDYDMDTARMRFNAKQTRQLRDEHEQQQAYREKRQLALQSADRVQDTHAKNDYIQQALARVKAEKNIMNKEKRYKIFKRFQENNPHPTTELVYHSPFELLIAVILSAQATDVSVNKATLTLFPIANTPETIRDLGLDGLKNFIKSIGLYNSKAENIIKTCDILINQFNSEVPNTREALESLPGVGRKTANVVLNTAFNQHTMAVDTHIFRVANRTGIAKGNTPLAVELGLLKNIAPEFLKDAHHWLILHGRYVCTARKPHCRTCLIQDLCEYKEKNLL